VTRAEFIAFLNEFAGPAAGVTSVCLVAHNGSAFDFPFLHYNFSQQKRVLPPQVKYCVDSMTLVSKLRLDGLLADAHISPPPKLRSLGAWAPWARSMHGMDALDKDGLHDARNDVAETVNLITVPAVWEHMGTQTYDWKDRCGKWDDVEAMMQRSRTEAGAGIEVPDFFDQLESRIDNWGDIPDIPIINPPDDGHYEDLEGKVQWDHPGGYTGPPAEIKAGFKCTSAREALHLSARPIMELLVRETNRNAAQLRALSALFRFAYAVMGRARTGFPVKVVIFILKLHREMKSQPVGAALRTKEEKERPFAYKPRPWKPVTLRDIEIWIGMTVAAKCQAGVANKMSLMWGSADWDRCVALRAHMPKTRWEQIKRYLHFSNRLEEVPYGRPGFDPLFKVRELNRVAMKQWAKVWEVGCFCACDESMRKCYCRTDQKFNMDCKAHDTGLFFWVLASGRPDLYIIGFRQRIKTQKYDLQAEGGKRLGTLVVTKLLAEAGLLDKGVTVVTDNYYSSEQLARTLLARKTYLIGMLKDDTAPPEINFTDEDAPRRGSIKYRISHDHKVLLTNWKDNKQVRIMTTAVGNAERNSVQRWIPEEHRTRWVPSTHAAKVYNLHMNSVDRVSSAEAA
jgi:hypothetical protein